MLIVNQRHWCERAHERAEWFNPPPVYSPPPVLYVQLNWLEVHRIVNKLIDRRIKEGTYCVFCHVDEYFYVWGSIRMIRLYDGMYPMPNDMLAKIGPPPTTVAIRGRSRNPRRDLPTPTQGRDARTTRWLHVSQVRILETPGT